MSQIPRDPSLYIDKRDARCDTVFLLPDSEADAFAFSAREDISRASNAAIAYAAALFIIRVRGLPLSEISVRTPTGVYEIRCVGNDGKYGILMPKCKILYTKTALFADKTDLKVQVVSIGDAICNVVKCTDADMMSRSALRRILLFDEGRGAAASIAVSESGGIITASAEFLSDNDSSSLLLAATAAAHQSRDREKEISVKIFDDYFTFSYDGDDLYAIEREPSIFTFHAPDLDGCS